jgi:hypothetical protein
VANNLEQINCPQQPNLNLWPIAPMYNEMLKPPKSLFIPTFRTLKGLLAIFSLYSQNSSEKPYIAIKDMAIFAKNKCFIHIFGSQKPTAECGLLYSNLNIN